MNFEPIVPEMVFVKKDGYDRMEASYKALLELHKFLKFTSGEHNTVLFSVYKKDVVRFVEQALSGGLYHNDKVVLTIIE